MLAKYNKRKTLAIIQRNSVTAPDNRNDVISQINMHFEEL